VSTASDNSCYRRIDSNKVRKCLFATNVGVKNATPQSHDQITRQMLH
jgi:hypothetical protein